MTEAARRPAGAFTRNSILPLGAAGAAVLIAAGILVFQDSAPAPLKPSPMTNMTPASRERPEAPPASRSDSAESPDPAAERLADAFEAATGHRAVYGVSKDGQIVRTRPLKIIRLPFSLALLTEQDIENACHPCGGAIGVFYLREKAGRFEVTGRWPRAVEGWDWGDPPSAWELTQKFTTYPAIYATGDFMGQGIILGGATITELRPSGPVTSDRIGISYDDEGNRPENTPTCIVKGRIANIRKDRSFDVLVSGSARAVDHYVKRNGRFVIGKKIRWDLPCGYSDGVAR